MMDCIRSHSARGAWIETVFRIGRNNKFKVALREGCVDRNSSVQALFQHPLSSHSARGAWIETIKDGILHCDRSGRTPRGVRG